MRLSARAAAAAALAAVLGLLLVPAATTSSLSAVSDFWIACKPTVQGQAFDPIVNPGIAAPNGSMHLHDFFGNKTISDTSTPDSLRAAGVGATSCTTSTDTAAYWAPTLKLFGGLAQTYGQPGCSTVCHYTGIRAYYGLGGASRAQIAVPSQEEAVVGGNSEATGPQSVAQVAFACGNSTPFHQYPYDCTPYINTGSDADGVIMRVIMPRCWDGVGGSRADFAYPSSGTGPNCPAGFPKVTPLINVRFHTGIVKPCVTGVCGVSDPAVAPSFGFANTDGSLKPWYQGHADFMNGWAYSAQDNPGGLDDLIKDCLQTAGACPVNPHTSPSSNMPS